MEDEYFGASSSQEPWQGNQDFEIDANGAAESDESAWRDAVKQVPFSEIDDLLGDIKKHRKSGDKTSKQKKDGVPSLSKKAQVKVGAPPIRDTLAAKLLKEEETQSSLEQQVQELTSTLLNEMAAPDLLPYRYFSLLQDRVRGQLDDILDQETSERYSPLERALLEMEANRYEFELVSYNRTRLRKIAKFPTYFLREQADRMSAEEINFAREYEQLHKNHFHDAFLSRLPEDFADLRDENDQDLYPKPDLKSYVIFNAKNKVGQLFPGEEAVMAGQTFAGPYNLVEDALRSGSITFV